VTGYLWDKGLSDQIAVALLAEEGRKWDAKYSPKRPRKGNLLAAAVLGDLRSDPAGTPAASNQMNELKRLVQAAMPAGNPESWRQAVDSLIRQQQPDLSDSGQADAGKIATLIANIRSGKITITAAPGVGRG
jgi:hypothetical protein